jgi:hypothetical protein
VSYRVEERGLNKLQLLGERFDPMAFAELGHCAEELLGRIHGCVEYSHDSSADPTGGGSFDAQAVQRFSL